jgi:hypothetical protein
MFSVSETEQMTELEKKFAYMSKAVLRIHTGKVLIESGSRIYSESEYGH